MVYIKITWILYIRHILKTDIHKNLTDEIINTIFRGKC